MSADEFWKDDPQLFVSYRTHFLNKKKREMEEYDYKSWLQGLYIHNGNGILVSSLKQFLGNMFSKSKDKTKLPTYPEKPFMEQEKELNEIKVKEKEEQKRESNYKNYENSLLYFGTMKARYKEKLKNKK